MSEPEEIVRRGVRADNLHGITLHARRLAAIMVGLRLAQGISAKSE
jgi:hypothetical protein